MFEFYAINKNKVGSEQFFYLFISVIKLRILSSQPNVIYKRFKNTSIARICISAISSLNTFRKKKSTHYLTLGLKPAGAFCGEFGFVIKLFETAE
jgi:hypothetical protein